jgi:hypothetical protein
MMTTGVSDQMGLMVDRDLRDELCTAEFKKYIRISYIAFEWFHNSIRIKHPKNVLVIVSI